MSVKNILKDVFLGVSNATKEIGNYMDINLKVVEATKAADLQFYEEKIGIEGALRLVDSRSKIDKVLSKGGADRESMLQSLEEVSPGSTAEAERIKRAVNAIPADASFAYTFPPAMLNSDPTINTHIQEKYQSILQQRSKFFSEIKQRIKTQKIPEKSIKEALYELEYYELWQHIS